MTMLRHSGQKSLDILQNAISLQQLHEYEYKYDQATSTIHLYYLQL